jgi:hypothetical protein
LSFESPMDSSASLVHLVMFSAVWRSGGSGQEGVPKLGSHGAAPGSIWAALRRLLLLSGCSRKLALRSPRSARVARQTPLRPSCLRAPICHEIVYMTSNIISKHIQSYYIQGLCVRALAREKFFTTCLLFNVKQTLRILVLKQR